MRATTIEQWLNIKEVVSLSSNLRESCNASESLELLELQVELSKKQGDSST
jgi:hypothetical protein